MKYANTVRLIAISLSILFVTCKDDSTSDYDYVNKYLGNFAFEQEWHHYHSDGSSGSGTGKFESQILVKEKNIVVFDAGKELLEMTVSANGALSADYIVGSGSNALHHTIDGSFITVDSVSLIHEVFYPEGGITQTFSGKRK
jgi:hypothetical protein